MLSRKFLSILLVLTSLFGAASSRADAQQDYAAALSQLPAASYSDKNEIVKTIVASQQPGARELLQAFLDGTLYARTADGQLFIVTEQGDQFQLVDVLTQKPAGSAAQSDFDKIGTNNGLRKTLRSAIAQFDLANPDSAVRLAAVTSVLSEPDEEVVKLLRERVTVESDGKVKKAITQGLALADLSSDDVVTRLAAIDALSSSLNPDVYNRLQAMLEKAEDGTYAEADEGVRIAARAAALRIERWRSFYSIVETSFFGLSLGSVLVLCAIGLAITFGVMGVINMAHGELMMLGAYTTYVVQLLMPNHIGLSILVSIPAAFLVSGGVGMLIERGVVKFLYGRPLETLLATFGVSLILQQLVRNVFSANNRPVETPEWLAGSLQINEAFSLTYNRIYVVLFTIIVFALLLFILKRTTLGLNVRAVSQNRAMAKAMGIRSEFVDMLTFGLGAGIAGVAGVALSQLTNVGPNLGQAYIVDAFMVVVFGGVGNLWGTLVGGMSLGVANKVMEPYFGAVLAKILVLVFLILFIQRKPRGLFPQKGRAAEH
ncbi:MAG: urea ABC transporter permease subunit UrtB [Steroidobacteraceae bacterium]